MSRITSRLLYTNEELEKISKDLTITLQNNQSGYTSFTSTVLQLYDILGDNDIVIPFSYKNSVARPDRSTFNGREIIFEGKLRENQLDVRKESISCLNDTGSVLISAYCGFGKSAMAINIACTIKLRTLIICHRIVLINQWLDTIKQFSPKSTVQILSGNSDIDNCDFYIINAINVPKYNNKSNVFNDIGCLIVDECHTIVAEKIYECMKCVFPRYVVGLSATPYRTDGLNSLIDLYFGKHKIIRELNRKHTVYKINTDFVPEIKFNKIGRLDWGSVLDSQANNEKRNDMIISIIRRYDNRNFLVLCKRVIQANYLELKLKEYGEKVTSLIGSNQIYDKDSRILIGTSSKIGVGFDHPKLDALILASDIEQYFIQYLGRVFRTQKVEPIIFDIVDKFPLLVKHYKTREEIYKKHGGCIKIFK